MPTPDATPHASTIRYAALRTALTACAALIACTTPPGPTPDPEVVGPVAGAEQTLRVVSWNVQGYPETEPGRQAESALVVAGLDADVLALQEVAGPDRVELFMQSHRDFTQVAYVNQGTPMDNAIVATGASTLGAMSPSEPSGQRMKYPQAVAWVEAGELDMTVMSIHTSFQGGDTEAILADLDRMTPSIEAALERDPDVLVIGDFNLRPEQMAALAARLGLVFVPAGGALTTSANAYDHALMSPSLHATYYVEGSGEVLDELFSVTDDSSPGRPVSDHYPIVYAFRIRAR
jgi:endonuclease/exonuclease/phosphatase family metal-dependent hydrolase